jgi:DeoR/GlpR family transcriptional regulator of sugar metabolism
MVVAPDYFGVKKTMLKQDRQRQIRQFVQAEGTATIADLAQRFFVTEMTIRRDLEELDRQGHVQRIHGGAMASGRRGVSLGEPPVLERVPQQKAAKGRIAQAVAGLIGAGETIFLGSGTTTLAVAEALADRGNLTVVTNALTVATALTASPAITVIVIGGYLRHSESSLVGHFAEATLQDLRLDRVIVGMRGVDPHHGLTSDNPEEQATDRVILKSSDTVIVVADHTKFGQVAAIRTAPVTAATTIVTDDAAPAEVVAGIEALGVRVIRV